MNVIKNIKLLHSLLDEGSLAKLEAGAELYQRHSRIEFKILSVEGQGATIRTVQSKSPAENYLSQSDLITRTKDLFDPVLTGYSIQVHAIEYVGSVVEVVTSEWIKKKMFDCGVSIKTIVTDTGIDKTSLSALVNGLKPLSQGMKSMFYYYFAVKTASINMTDFKGWYNGYGDN